MRRFIACRQGKPKWSIMFLVSSVCVCLAYYRFAMSPLGRNRLLSYFTRDISTSPIALTTYQNHTPGVGGESRIFEATRHINVAGDLLLNKSTCGRNQYLGNTTRCSTCLRPGVPKLPFNFVTTEYLNLTQYKNYFKTAPSVVQNLITEYLITPNLECPYLLAVQPSLKGRPWERDLVRKTWGSVAETQTWPNRNINAKVKILFVVANMNNTEQAKQQNHTLQFDHLLNESRLHNDILYINMVDGYYNLTLKLLSAFKWVKDNCPCTKFVLKVDFDTFVNVPLLIDMLIHHEDSLNNSIMGKVHNGHNRVRIWGKWAVPSSLYPAPNFPYYTSGCGYVLSMKVISQIVDTVPYFRILIIEDAFITGVLRLVIGYQMAGVSSAFTHFHDRLWHHCQMFNDTKVLGLTVNKHKFLWQMFHNSSCS